MNKLLPLVALCLISLLLTTKAAQSAYTDGKAAQLKAADVKKLKALKTAIAVPTYVPAGYRLKEVSSNRQEDGATWSIDYNLAYENAKGNSFNINSANEGIGDALILPVLKGKNPFFKGTIQLGPPDLTAQSRPRGKPEVGADWIESKSDYTPKDALSPKQYYRLSGKGLSEKEAFKIMMSLRYLQ